MLLEDKCSIVRDFTILCFLLDNFSRSRGFRSSTVRAVGPIISAVQNVGSIYLLFLRLQVKR